MTDIVIRKSEKSYQVSVRGHCKRDVCIAVSAIVNTLAQYTDDFRDNNSGFRTDSVKTCSGNSLISVYCEDKRLLRRYMSGVKALEAGMALYAHHFPGEISMEKTGCRTSQN